MAECWSTVNGAQRVGLVVLSSHVSRRSLLAGKVRVERRVFREYSGEWCVQRNGVFLMNMNCQFTGAGSEGRATTPP